MNANAICNDFMELIAGTSNRYHPAYMEAAKNISSDKSTAYMKNFVTNIEDIANKDKVKDKRITESRGNIRSFKGYENIVIVMDFLKKNTKGVQAVTDLENILKALEKYQPQYTEGYTKQLRMVILEYEAAADLLITGLAMAMAECVDVEAKDSNVKIKTSKPASNITFKTINDLAKQLSDAKHKQYLDEWLKSKQFASVDTKIQESVIMEAAVADTLELIDVMINSIGRIGHYTANIVRTIKNSLFGIVPLIRSCLYLRYKKKADTVLALEQQAEFIKQNIEHLENRTNMDPSEKSRIIKRQQATIEAYKKKAAKLRAELSDGEREASNELNKSNPNMGKTNPDDDFVLD